MPVSFRKVTYRLHAVQRMFETQISREHVLQVLENGEAVEKYPNDKPYPSELLLGLVGERLLHVVIALNPAEDEAIVITAYWPDDVVWLPGYRSRKK